MDALRAPSPPATPTSPHPAAAGRITSLVAKGDRVLAERIEEALQRGLPLDALSANKHVLPQHMRCGAGLRSGACAATLYGCCCVRVWGDAHPAASSSRVRGEGEVGCSRQWQVRADCTGWMQEERTRPCAQAGLPACALKLVLLAWQ